MDYDEIISRHRISNNAQIVLLVLDGLGDLPNPEYDNKTPLEYAKTLNLDKLVKESVLGRIIPILPGITPGSGPAHLGLFGYDPLKNEIGRGVLEAIGLGIDLKSNEIAARSNFASINDDLIVTDRRAGRIEDSKGDMLCEALSTIKEIDGIKIKIKPGKEHRFVTVFSSEDKEIGSSLSDTDPQKNGMTILKSVGRNDSSQYLAEVVNKFTEKSLELLKNQYPANGILLRGFSSKPKIMSIDNKYKLSAAAIAEYPMYRGLASLLGFKLMPLADSIEGLFNCYLENKNKYDFFFIHVKGTDKSGEDGDFIAKVKCIEEVDRQIHKLVSAKADVICITGDHSTPALMGAHSWHPVPLLINGKYCGADRTSRFTENECIMGGVGTIESKYLMGLLLANAGKMKKFGA